MIDGPEHWQGEWRHIMRIAEPAILRASLRPVFEETARAVLAQRPELACVSLWCFSPVVSSQYDLEDWWYVESHPDLALVTSRWDGPPGEHDCDADEGGCTRCGGPMLPLQSWAMSSAAYTPVEEYLWANGARPSPLYALSRAWPGARWIGRRCRSVAQRGREWPRALRSMLRAGRAGPEGRQVAGDAFIAAGHPWAPCLRATTPDAEFDRLFGWFAHDWLGPAGAHLRSLTFHDGWPAEAHLRPAPIAQRIPADPLWEAVPLVRVGHGWQIGDVLDTTPAVDLTAADGTDVEAWLARQQWQGHRLALDVSALPLLDACWPANLTQLRVQRGDVAACARHAWAARLQTLELPWPARRLPIRPEPPEPAIRWFGTLVFDPARVSCHVPLMVRRVAADRFDLDFEVPPFDDEATAWSSFRDFTQGLPPGRQMAVLPATMPRRELDVLTREFPHVRWRRAVEAVARPRTRVMRFRRSEAERWAPGPAVPVVP